MPIAFRTICLGLIAGAWICATSGLASAQAPSPADRSASAAPAPLDKAALADYLRYLNLWGENVTITLSDPKASTTLPGFLDLQVTASVPGASLTQEYYVTPDGARLIRGRASDRLGKTVFSTGDYPFRAEQEALKLGGRPSVGKEDAPITVAVFSDFQCAYCRDEAKLLRANLLSAYPEAVRMVFVDFPLVQIHNWAKPAAIAGHCLAAISNDTFWKYHDWAFETQPQITAENFGGKLQAWAEGSGIDTLQLQQCLQSSESDAAVTTSLENALNLGLNSTPTLFVNGRQVTGKLEWAAIKQIVDAELDYQFKQASKQQASKEACCTVTLPGLFPQ
ncbi:MAG: thioredoxin domain-containing protein [Bryobacterales bacterium]|nr:thioredoxin domain-containing protein [Bryobacterales bacterium]